MEQTNKKDKFMILLLILFIIFLILYVATKSGYYEYKVHSKVELTSESIKKFEQDIKDGLDVSIKDYVTSSYKDYSNTFADVGYNVGKIIETVLNKGIKKTVKVLTKLFYE